MTEIQSTLFTGSDQSKITTDDYYTPKWIFDLLQLRFDMDVASPTGGIPWIPTNKYFTIADDGLSQDWIGRIWCNPPFSKPGPWADRMIAHNNGILLCPFSNARWMDRVWQSSCAMVKIEYGLKFERPTGPLAISYPTFLAAWGEENAEAISRVGKRR